jgi:branched-chain amino acid transport system permease protein
VLGPERFNTIIGIVFLIIVLLSPGGLVGLWERVSDRVKRRPTVGPGAEGPPQQALSSEVP